MQTAIVIFILFILGVFIYMWYEFHSALRLHTSLKEPILNKGLKLIKKTITTSDGLRISSWYIPVKNPKAIVILVHGYKEEDEGKASMLKHAQYLNKAGYATMLIDLRSFGESEGKKITLGVNEWRDIEAAYDFAKSFPENKDKKIGFLGISMGGVISIITSAITGKGDFIISSTPYANFKNLFAFKLRKRGLPSFIFLPSLRIAALFELGHNYEYYTAINMIKKVDVPIFITSAKHDQIVNLNDAKYLFDNANNPKEFWQAATTHDIFRDNPTVFQKKILNFLSKYI